MPSPNASASPTTPDAARERCVETFRRRWGEPDVVSRAPGRVNLIGEHTDYNEGFTLPMALPFDTVVAIGAVPHGAGVARDAADPEAIRVDAGDFGEFAYRVTDDPTTVPSWARHIAGVAHLLAVQGISGGGWCAAVDTDIPYGASLSSSAALEVAFIRALLARGGVEWSALEVARLGQRVENEVVGLPSGIMDQFISAGAVEGHASLMDCRALTLTPAPLPSELVVAVMDTGTRRVLADAAYADRRAACERAAAALGVSALRDATAEMVASLDDPELRRRAGHVVAENRRVLEAAEAMRIGDLERLGALMNASHASLRDDYEVSGPGLDAIVDVAVAAPGCRGARMTGGGFAGCAVALVDAVDADAFVSSVVDRYDYDGHTAQVWLCSPSAGASIVSAPDVPA